MPELIFDCRHRYDSGFTLDAAFSAQVHITAIFGPSGAGKSTLLEIIAGTLRPDDGAVSLAGRPLLDTRARCHVPPHRRGIGFVPQDALLFPHLSVRRNIQYGARRRPRRRIEFHALVDLLDLGGLLDRAPATLSGGEKQRVALARAILRGPDLLLLDEPFAALDQPRKSRILEYLAKATAEWRIPALYVSHDQVDVRQLADQVVVLDAGRVVAVGPTAATLDHVALAGRAAQTALVNLLRVEQVRRVGAAWDGFVGDQPCQLIAGAGDPPPTVWVQFAPSAVTLSRSDPAGTSVRNRFRAMVCELVPVAGRVFVGLDLGQRCWAEITPAAVAELELAPGMAVYCLIKSAALAPVL